MTKAPAMGAGAAGLIPCKLGCSGCCGSMPAAACGNKAEVEAAGIAAAAEPRALAYREPMPAHTRTGEANGNGVGAQLPSEPIGTGAECCHPDVDVGGGTRGCGQEGERTEHDVAAATLRCAERMATVQLMGANRQSRRAPPRAPALALCPARATA